MNLSAWGIRNPVAVVVLFALLCGAGLLVLPLMKVQSMPDIDLPTVSVNAALSGAAPAQLETDVARKLENAVAAVPGIRHVYTTIRDGSVSMLVEFRLEKPVQSAVEEVRSAITRVRPELPSSLREPQVSKLDLATQPVLGYALRPRQPFAVRGAALDELELSWLIDGEIARTLLAVPGVAAVSRVGGATRQVSVVADPLRLQARGIALTDLARALRAVQADAGGGRAHAGGGEQALQVLVAAQSAQQLAQVELALADGRRVRLGDVAQVRDGPAEQRGLAMFDGRPVVGFEISRSRGASEVEVGDGVRRALGALMARHPQIAIDETFDFVQPVREEYAASMQMLLEGALLAVVVVWVFLRDWRATVVSAVALPLSLAPTFAAMYLFGFSLNMVTLLALSLVVGILVDDAIVEVENIVRHLRMDKSPLQAAIDASAEIGLAVVATSLTLVVVFLPTAFMGGAVGRFFSQFGWTASVAVLMSLLVARLLTPMLAVRMLRPHGAHAAHEEREAHQPRWMASYLKLARYCLYYRGRTMLAAGVFFVVSSSLIVLLPSSFLPPDDFPLTQVRIELPPGVRIAQTRAAAEQARQAIAALPAVRSVHVTVGSVAGENAGDSDINAAVLTLRLAERGQRPRRQQIEAELRAALQAADLAGARIKVGLNSSDRYVLTLSGDDSQALARSARAIARQARALPGVAAVTTSAASSRTAIAVRVDTARAAELGVDPSALAETLRLATLGEEEHGAPRVNLPQRQVPVVLRLSEAARGDWTQLAALRIPAAGGRSVALSQVAQLEPLEESAVIERRDRKRNINIELEMDGLSLGEAEDSVMQLPAVRQLPPGISAVSGAEAESMQELFGGFGAAMAIGVLCIYAVLAVLFGSLLHPWTILAALPLAAGGAFIALLAARQELSMPALIGLVMLMGVATKNSILLVDYAIALRRGGMARSRALIQACAQRARPILMTTVAMGAGMLPAALGLGAADPSFRLPMALALIGGLASSTALSLLVIAPAFTYAEDAVLHCGRLLRRLRPRAPSRT
ncbi:MAG: Multidrug resistance protein MdtC [Herbaspirillum frisingense]|uniref:Multidrug resistance protein MdtC n=1 Tax=Herbaspirillum frisingense TaxID=92645 RepID=A0A7V8FYH9_9BURK|nr:MAG: Multidrug resistance protein MdtC [Herbaspirillum frisingense]